MRFHERIALITGAASGIGRATAEIMAREGATVVGVDNNQERLDTVVNALNAAGGRAQGRLCNVLDPAQVDALVSGVHGDFSRIDILVNAVGGSTIIAKQSATIEEHSLDDWQRVLDFNLNGTFNLLHAVIPVMKAQRGGKIVNLSSIAGRGLSPSSGSAYAAAKGGIIALTRKLSFELGPYNVNINAIAPSTTLTERIRPRWHQRPPEEQRRRLANTPLGRVAEPEDQANVICFLASSDADFVTGLTIDVTGGQSG
ncbi:MAG: SDR family NAD(P)-dependent oxidoreductase [Acetobacteraceae bacterium]